MTATSILINLVIKLYVHIYIYPRIQIIIVILVVTDSIFAITKRKKKIMSTEFFFFLKLYNLLNFITNNFTTNNFHLLKIISKRQPSFIFYTYRINLLFIERQLSTLTQLIIGYIKLCISFFSFSS